MGIWDAFADMVEAVTPWSVVEAEAPAEESKQEEQPDESSSKDDDAKEEKTEDSDDSEAKEDDGSEEDGGDKEEGGDDAGEEEDEEEEDEDDEEEIVDPKEQLEEECKNSPQCHVPKHHFEECVERVQKQEEEGGAKEDCVEEFFHLAHCATTCAAPKLWSKLK